MSTLDNGNDRRPAAGLNLSDPAAVVAVLVIGSVAYLMAVRAGFTFGVRSPLAVGRASA